MGLKLTKEQIEVAATNYADQQYAEVDLSSWTNDHNGFVAGANFVLQKLQQADVSGSLPLIEKAIDDTFNQVHYSHLHPDVVNPIEHNEWRDKWIKENYGNNR